MKTLSTRWAVQAECDCPLQDYPRPSMVRDNWCCLNGMYQYAVTDLAATDFPDTADGLIRVPFAIESSLSGVCKKVSDKQLLWYRKIFHVMKENGKRILLHFGAVDWECTVYINATAAGTHQGGYCPFTLDITELVTDGDNELKVKVYDPTDRGSQSRGKQCSKSHGFWYTSTTGIWQTVWLEQVPVQYIASYRLTPDIDMGCLRMQTAVSAEEGYRLHIQVLDGEDTVFSGDIGTDALIPISGAKLWSPENPFLYTFTLTLSSATGEADRVTGYFAMRKFGLLPDRDGLMRLALNNEPYFQRGLLDQGYWADGGLTAPTDEAMIYDIETMKRLGFNMLRKHIKVEPERWYYHCDRLGMIVWQDMVSGGSKPLDVIHAGVLPNIFGVLSPAVNLSYSDEDAHYAVFGRDSEDCRKQWEQELYEVIDTLYNHPCIGCWVPFNEGWGQFDALRISHELQSYDRTRVVDHASGWYDRGGGQLHSIHKYILPVVVPKNDGRPFVLSEYGGYSQILDGHVWNKGKSFGYQMYKSKNSLTKAYRELHEKQIIPKIKKGLSATVYTQLSDVEFEVNGLLTYDREILKIDEETLRQINQKLTY